MKQFAKGREPIQLSMEQAEKAVALFNRLHHLGDCVTLRKPGLTELVSTRTRSEAFVLGKTPVVYLEGEPEAWHIDLVAKILGGQQ